MSCSSVDLKAYQLGELAQSEKASVEDHVRACQGCRVELDRLRLTQSALLSLEDEEMPRRIAFVSDKVFEPRWWQTMWHSAPTMGFASAALLTAAILVHGFTRPVPAATTATVDTAQIEQRIEREVQARLDASVAKAVSESEAKQAKQFAVLDASEKRLESQRREDRAMLEQAARYYKLQSDGAMVAMNNARPGQ